MDFHLLFNTIVSFFQLYNWCKSSTEISELIAIISKLTIQIAIVFMEVSSLTQIYNYL